MSGFRNAIEFAEYLARMFQDQGPNRGSGGRDTSVGARMPEMHDPRAPMNKALGLMETSDAAIANAIRALNSTNPVGAFRDNYDPSYGNFERVREVGEGHVPDWLRNVIGVAGDLAAPDPFGAVGDAAKVAGPALAFLPKLSQNEAQRLFHAIADEAPLSSPGMRRTRPLHLNLGDVREHRAVYQMAEQMGVRPEVMARRIVDEPDLVDEFLNSPEVLMMDPVRQYGFQKFLPSARQNLQQVFELGDPGQVEDVLRRVRVESGAEILNEQLSGRLSSLLEGTPLSVDEVLDAVVRDNSDDYYWEVLRGLPEDRMNEVLELAEEILAGTPNVVD